MYIYIYIKRNNKKMKPRRGWERINDKIGEEGRQKIMI